MTKRVEQNHSASIDPLPVAAGIGLRGPHMRELLDTRPDVSWLEVHSENFFGDGGAPIHNLLRVREHYPISLHGVGLSMGSSDALDPEHLSRLLRLTQMIEPGLVSEHLSWGSVGGIHFNDLLPLPYTEEALNHFCSRVVQVQDYLGRQILIENPSSYLGYRHSTIPEWEFLTAISERTGAGLLLDVNNVFVSACNHNFEPMKYLAAVPGELVEEIHLAGHTLKKFPDRELRIDDHASPVCDDVWSLYGETLKLMGGKPTLIEWDAELPPFNTLLAEADVARQHLEA
jgi:uncharacterized protein (UPF0276 family)